MAQPQTSAQRPGQSQQNDAGTAGTGGASGAPATPPGTQSGMQGRAASGATPTGEPRADQERQRPVSRESTTGTSAGTGMQRGTRQGSLASGREPGQGSVLPALMSNPWLMTNAFMANPFGFAQAMSQEMDRLFSSGFGEPVPFGQTATGGQSGRSLATQRQQGSRGLGQWMPQVEVRQRGNDLVVSADLPGLKPDEVDIEIEDGVLTISGERQQSTEDRDQSFYRSERSYGAFSRSIALPEGVDEDQVQARFEHGVLEVTVPIPQQRPRGRRVQIQAGSGSSVGSQPSAQASRQRSGQAAGASSSDRSPGAPGSSGTT